MVLWLSFGEIKMCIGLCDYDVMAITQKQHHQCCCFFFVSCALLMICTNVHIDWLHSVMLDVELYTMLFVIRCYTVPNVELPALCSPRFRSGPPSEIAQTASLFLHDVIMK